jgi:hypothetical protein
VFHMGSTFNFAYNADWGYPVKFESAQWLSLAELKQALQKVEGSDKQGDIFVKAPALS